MNNCISTPVLQIRIGNIVTFGPNNELSAINKYPVKDQQWVGMLGLTGDQQADKRHHGGKDKAVHHFPSEHYQYLNTLHPTHYLKVGDFGENISTYGLTEKDVFLGDIFQVGNVVLELSQGRLPCWKLSHRSGIGSLAQQLQSEVLTGWYYRVVQEGFFAVGDSMCLIDRPYPNANLEKIMRILLSFGDKDTTHEIDNLLMLSILPRSWTERLVALKEKKKLDDTLRLVIPMYKEEIEK